MGLPDILSDDEMSQLEGGGVAAAPDFSGGLPDILSNDQMTALETVSSRSAPSTGWDVPGMLKQGLSGAAKGAASTLGMLGDVGNILTGNFSQNYDPDTGEFSMFPSLNLMQDGAAAILPAEDPNHRYAHTIGEFVGGQGPFSIFSKAAIAPRAIASAIGSGIGARGAEDLTGDNTIAPLIGAIAGGLAPSVATDLGSAFGSVFRPATADEITGSAALAMKQATGLSPKDIAAGIIANPNDDLSTLRTTAELTNNAGMAQLEKQLAKTGTAAGRYAELGDAREGVRNAMIDSMTPVPAVNKEGLGSRLINRGREVQGLMDEAAEGQWKLLDRDVSIDIAQEQSALESILSSKQAGLAPKGDARTLIEQFRGAASGRLSSGALQDLRSDALRLLRDGKLSSIEERALAAITGGTDEAMERGFSAIRDEPEKYAVWAGARRATAANAETFRRGTAGGALLEDMARPSNVLSNAIKGDARSIQELRAAIGNEPQLINEVRRGFLDKIPRNVDDQITPNGMKQFLAANEGSIRELLGEDHLTSMRRILSDLRSQDKVQKVANLASKGNSITSQSTTVAGVLDDLLAESVVPGSGKLASLANGVKNVLGINNKQQVADLLFRASMEPSFALELSQAPTTTRIFNGLERLQAMGRNAAQAGGLAAGIELSRPRPDGSSVDPSQAPQRLTPPASTQARPSTAGAIGSAPQVSPGASTPFPQLPQSTTTGGQSGPGAQLQQSSSSNSASIFSKDQSLSEPSVFAKVLDAVKLVESSGDPSAIGPETKYGRAKGAYQFLDSTGKEYHKKLGIKEPYDPHNEPQQRKLAAAYITDLLEMFDGDMELALTAFHTGPGNVKKGKIGPIGRNYARSVFEKV